MGNESNTWLKVEHWYHVFVALGATGAIASLSVDVKGISNAHALLLSLGLMFIGVGEWINHPLQTRLMHPSVYAPGGGIITGHPRSASALGSLFDVLGFLLLGVAVFKISMAA